MNIEYLPIICVFFNLFGQCFIVVCVQVFHFLGKIYSNYLLGGVTIMHGAVFLIFFSDRSLLVYRNVTDFCMSYQIVYSHSFWCCLWSFLHMRSCCLQLKALCFNAFCFFLFIALGRISVTVLNRSGKSDHASLALDLREKAFNFPPLSITSAVSLLDWP
jgi:hypothetical protein